jgi:stearoyl-CoA desaturase (delta-9 desaturase)
MKLKVSTIGLLQVIIYPVFVISLFINYCIHYNLSIIDLYIFIIGYTGSTIGAHVGLHRLWSHGAFKPKKFVEFILILLSAGAMQGPALVYASAHYRHHKHTDEALDPHSPKKHKNKLKGLYWAHVGWMFPREIDDLAVDDVTKKKFRKNKLLFFDLKYH